MKKTVLLLITLTLIVSSILAACATQAPAPTPAPAPAPAPTPTPAPTPEVKELRAVAQFNLVNNDSTWASQEFILRFNRRAGADKLGYKINLLGGPEIMDPNEQSEALSRGVFDMAHLAGGYIVGQMPIANSFMLSKLESPIAERDAGYYDFINQHFEEQVNMHYLGRAMWDFAQIWVNKPIKTVDELKGMKLRVTGSNAPWIDELGAVGVSLAWPETYSALEQGVASGLATWLGSYYGRQIYEVAPYAIAHRTLQADAIIMVNLDTWKQLPKNVQDAMTEEAIEVEKVLPEHSRLTIMGLVTEMKEKYGYQDISFSAEDAKTYTDAAYNGFWKSLAKDLDSATIETLKKMLKS